MHAKRADKTWLGLQKILLSGLSSKLMITEQLSTDRMSSWKYKVNETGEKGNLF